MVYQNWKNLFPKHKYYALCKNVNRDDQQPFYDKYMPTYKEDTEFNSILGIRMPIFIFIHNCFHVLSQKVHP